jgi:hypothetical protein
MRLSGVGAGLDCNLVLGGVRWRSELAERVGGVGWRSELADRLGGLGWRTGLAESALAESALAESVGGVTWRCCRLRRRTNKRFPMRLSGVGAGLDFNRGLDGVRCRCGLAERLGGPGWRSELAERVGGASWRSELAERVGGVTWRSCFRQAWSLVRFGCGFLARDLVGEWVPNASACHPPCVRGVRTAGADVSWPTLPLELRPLTSRPIRIRPQSETNRPIRRQSGAQNKTVLSSARSDCGWRGRRGRAGTFSIWQ